MKQIIRFFFQPATFINQLQWSRNHGLILMTFLGVALVESQVGVGKNLNQQLAWLLSQHSGLDREVSLLAVTAGRIAFLFFGALSLSETLWWLGTRLGRPTSKRVLYRRLSIVLTLLLAAYTLYAMPSQQAELWAWGLASWSLLLSYLTLREQFSLGRVNSAVLGLLAVGVIVLGWQVSDRVAETATGYAIADQVARVRPGR